VCSRIKYRLHVTRVLQHLWSVPGHRAAFCTIGEPGRRGDFVKFANGLMNHNNAMVTDSLHHLSSIKRLQVSLYTVRWKR
jgi:hypothetical protein